MPIHILSHINAENSFSCITIFTNIKIMLSTFLQVSFHCFLFTDKSKNQNKLFAATFMCQSSQSAPPCNALEALKSDPSRPTWPGRRKPGRRRRRRARHFCALKPYMVWYWEKQLRSLFMHSTALHCRHWCMERRWSFIMLHMTQRRLVHGSG